MPPAEWTPVADLIVDVTLETVGGHAGLRRLAVV
jgi:hypothetical protein